MVAFNEETTGGLWRLRVTMTPSVEDGARDDQYVPDIESACDLLRRWYARATAGGPLT